MRVGIVGLPGSGKTAVFRAVARGGGREEHGSHVAVVPVPDKRFDWLVQYYHPKKATPATVEFVEGAARIGGEPGKGKFGADFFADVRKVDALVHVVRCFANDLGEPPTPVSDARELSDELLLADLQVVETRLSRIEKALHGVRHGAVTPETIERDLVERIGKALEEGKRVDTLEFTADEDRLIRGFDFLTRKPQILVANIPEDQIGKETAAVQELREYASEIGVDVLVTCAELEAQIAELPKEEQEDYLAAMGLSEPESDVLIRECYKALGLITFFTAGEPEVRAWTIPAGSRVIEAAEKIHTDLARGFIRAEVASFDTVKEAGGWEEAKRKGLVQLYAKDYVVQDGDVIYIRFKV
jgi:GTP-binding protein YchF